MLHTKTNMALKKNSKQEANLLFMMNQLGLKQPEAVALENEDPFRPLPMEMETQDFDSKDSLHSICKVLLDSEEIGVDQDSVIDWLNFNPSFTTCRDEPVLAPPTTTAYNNLSQRTTIENDDVVVSPNDPTPMAFPYPLSWGTVAIEDPDMMETDLVKQVWEMAEEVRCVATLAPDWSCSTACLLHFNSKCSLSFFLCLFRLLRQSPQLL